MRTGAPSTVGYSCPSPQTSDSPRNSSGERSRGHASSSTRSSTALTLLPHEAQVAEGREWTADGAREGRQRVVLALEHVVRGKHAAAGERGPDGLELEEHVLPRVQAVVEEEVDLAGLGEQRRKQLARVPQPQLPAPA